LFNDRVKSTRSNTWIPISARLGDLEVPNPKTCKFPTIPHYFSSSCCRSVITQTKLQPNGLK